MMSNVQIEELMASLRARADAAPEREPLTAGCLSFGRARALALDGRRWRDEDRAHSAACRRCQALIGQFARLAPHPSLWGLLRAQLGLLDGRDARALEYHLTPEGCVRCRERLASLGGGGPVIRFQGLSLPNPAAAAAASGPLDVEARSSDGRLEAELVEDEREIQLEVRTREASLNHHLVGYSMRGAGPEEQVAGFLVLAPDIERWYAAHTVFEPEALYARLRGRCQELLVAPIVAGALGAGERELLLACAERQRSDPAARAAWAAWAASAEQDSMGEKWDLLRELRERIGG